MDDDESKIEFGWLGLMDDVFHYSPVLAVEDKFWRIKSDTRLKILEGWMEALEVLIEGNEEFGHDDEAEEEAQKEITTAKIIQFPNVQ